MADSPPQQGCIQQPPHQDPCDYAENFYRNWKLTLTRFGLIWKLRKGQPRCSLQAVNREASVRMAKMPQTQAAHTHSADLPGPQTTKQASLTHPPGKSARCRLDPTGSHIWPRQLKHNLREATNRSTAERRETSPRIAKREAGDEEAWKKSGRPQSFPITTLTAFKLLGWRSYARRTSVNCACMAG
ncbi:Hypothetical predicted protein [Pelobates cultripes]|uniref:Uncharacterized protein n=1 Tax=Pelobates cultripes TaxID=61616 RepID=A0AAD1VRN6_PELCU|nr:Hypothetical predicted protein [Pelobates cultripes]